jgi:hypothetical protein
MKEYYARRAAEYDVTSCEAFDEAERKTVERFVASLPPSSTSAAGPASSPDTFVAASSASTRARRWWGSSGSSAR